MTKPHLIARQAITDVHRQVVAYELFDRSHGHHGHNTVSDISLYFNAMNHTGNELSAGSVALFINRTHQSLGDVQLDFVQPNKVVLEIQPIPGHEPTQIEALCPTLVTLRERGYRLAFNHTAIAPAYASWRPHADYVKLDVQAIQPDQLKPIVAAVKARTSAKIVAEKIETQAQFESMDALGTTLFQGFWVGHPDLVKTHVVAPSQLHVLQLFNLVRNQAELHDIEEVLKKDAMLGFNLLRLINSAGFGLTQTVTSFRQAVMLMGMKKLFRWAALLMAVTRADGVPSVVGTEAVVRGRMMELLGAGTLTQDQADDAFLVGVFSKLDELLSMSLESALDLLTLSQETRDAVLHGSGLYGRMLALTKACENNDDEAFAAAATALNYSNHHINVAHMEALVWADTLGE